VVIPEAGLHEFVSTRQRRRGADAAPPALPRAVASSRRVGGEFLARSVRQSARVAAQPQQARTEVDALRQLELFEQASNAPEQRAAGEVVRLDRARRSDGQRPHLTLGEAARIIREAVKDKSYRKTPLGQLVGRYLRWFRNEYGATESTLRDYEAILARMSLLLADREPLEVSTEDLREVIDTWSMRQARTRAKVTSVIRAFWVWAEEEGHVPFSPASRIRRPRAPRKTAPLLPAHVDELLLGCARTTRDRLALLVLLDCGVRRAELGGVRVRDFDVPRRQLTVYGKGQKERVVPLRGRIVMALKAYLGEPLEFLGRRPEPEDYLLYPEKRTPDRRVYWADPKKPCAPNTVHRWWYRMLEQAGLVGHGVRSGLNMHRARHTFATELRRVAGVEAASQALGHSDLSTTLGIYGHQDQRDLERAMEALADSRGNDSPIVPSRNRD
jgi:integrase/recombinase XerD